MVKVFVVLCLLAVSLQKQPCVANVITNDLKLSFEPNISSKWQDHAMDFLKLIDLDKVLSVAIGYLDDPEVLHFITFVMSDEFRDLVWKFETITEFKEAFKFLADKGYDVETAINTVNTALELPPFEKPTRAIITRGTGMKGFIDDIMAILPLDEFKKLFETKLETSPEVAELFNTINSPEFLDIMERMAKNPEFKEFKIIFEKYGFDFKYLCNLAEEVLGEYYQGVFCGK